MTTNRTLTYAFTGLLSLALATTAFAGPPQGGADGKGGPDAGILARIARVLDLTEAQQDMLAGFKADAESLRAEIQAEKEAMRELFKTELSKRNPNGKALHDAVDDEMEKVAARKHDQVDNVLEFHETLSDEQVEELGEALAKGPPERPRGNAYGYGNWQGRGPGARGEGPRGPEGGKKGRHQDE